MRLCFIRVPDGCTAPVSPDLFPGTSCHGISRPGEMSHGDLCGMDSWVPMSDILALPILLSVCVVIGVFKLLILSAMPHWKVFMPLLNYVPSAITIVHLY